MPVLTEHENLIMRGVVYGTMEERNIALNKLRKFQDELTSKEHVKAVNSFIPQAEAVAEKKETQGYSFDVHFHREMNNLTRGAGLRL